MSGVLKHFNFEKVFGYTFISIFQPSNFSPFELHFLSSLVLLEIIIIDKSLSYFLLFYEFFLFDGHYIDFICTFLIFCHTLLLFCSSILLRIIDKWVTSG